MFKIIRAKIKKIVNEGTDTWSGRVPQPQQVRPTELPSKGNIPVQPLPQQPSVHDLRNNLIEAELYEEVQSVNKNHTKIIPAGSSNPGSVEKRSFTEEGLVTTKQEHLLSTADGRLITSSELHGGGKCTVCPGYTDKHHLYFCAVCRRPLCFRCAIPWENNTKVCPAHYQILIFNQDTWD